MKLKKILPNLDGLDEALHSLYTKGADGKFHLELEDDDAEPLRRAKEHEKNLREIAERDLSQAKKDLEVVNGKVTELNDQIKKLEGAQSTDVQTLRETLTRENEERIRKIKEDHEKEKGSLETTIKKVFVSDVANKLAGEIAKDEGAAELLAQIMANRLQVEIVNGEPKTRVLQADGKPSGMSPDELKEEYFTNEKYAGIMRASGASGGGASGGSNNRDGVPKKLSEMGDKERTEWYNRDPAGFERARQAGE